MKAAKGNPIKIKHINDVYATVLSKANKVAESDPEFSDALSKALTENAKLDIRQFLKGLIHGNQAKGMKDMSKSIQELEASMPSKFDPAKYKRLKQNYLDATKSAEIPNARNSLSEFIKKSKASTVPLTSRVTEAPARAPRVF
eukprot:NODE_119_length_18186_cov_1.929397.p12 type:complete len:143 gc:universal NODE_119_length_18186_cov_1.929397:4268-4696(+)